MFVILKKKKLNRMDAFKQCVSASVRMRSIKPLTWLFRKGRYGTNQQLEGRFYDYMKYCERTGRQIGVVIK